MTIALIIGGIAMIAAAVLIWSATGLLSHKRRSRARLTTQPPPLPPQLNRSGAMSALPPAFRSGSPPPLPLRLLNSTQGAPGSSSRLLQPILLREATESRIYNYPKCPYHRIRNIPGQRQVIFWDDTKKVFHCYKGHDFTGREH